jgi:hypothetical protein
MEQTKPMTHITAGLLLAGLLVVYSIIVNFLGLTGQSGINLIQYLIIIGGLVFVIKRHGREHNYQVSFGNLFAFGFKSTAVFTIIFIAFTVLLFLLFPDLKEKTFEMAREQMEKNKRFSDSEIDSAIEMARKVFWVGIVGGTMFFLILIGAIGSLLGAALTKKYPQLPFDQQNS